MKKLIINADDYGMSLSANEAITTLLLEKKISSASLMANGVYYDSAKELILHHALQDVGIHLAVTRDAFITERPLLYDSISGASTLIDEEGHLYTSLKEVKTHGAFWDLVKEIRSQLQKIMDDGIPITHIDNHMYSLFPGLGMKGFGAVMMAYWQVKEKGATRGIRLATSHGDMPGFYELWGGRKTLPVLKMCMGLLSLHPVDRCYSFPFQAKQCPTLEEKVALFYRFLERLPEGITELHMHPCCDSEHLRQYNPTWQHRVHEYQLLKQMDLTSVLNSYGVELTSYRDLCRK